MNVIILQKWDKIIRYVKIIDMKAPVVQHVLSCFGEFSGMTDDVTVLNMNQLFNFNYCQDHQSEDRGDFMIG